MAVASAVSFSAAVLICRSFAAPSGPKCGRGGDAATVVGVACRRSLAAPPMLLSNACVGCA
jgi:hypothetical protein